MVVILLLYQTKRYFVIPANACGLGATTGGVDGFGVAAGDAAWGVTVVGVVPAGTASTNHAATYPSSELASLTRIH